MTPEPTIRLRVKRPSIHDQLLRDGLHPLLADLLAGRLEQAVSVQDCMQPALSGIKDPAAIPDMDRAVERIVRGLCDREAIILAVDHDMDGQASAAVIWRAMVDFFDVDPARLSVVSSHRLNEGYGITESVADRILESAATLIISADKGSSDEARIRRIAAGGKDVIVTDHHEVPQAGPPASAYACVNPAREDSHYDRYICGAAVAFLTMTKVRSELIRRGVKNKIDSLVPLLDYVAVATIADCVALRPDKAFTNRAFVRRGLAAIRAQSRPCWQVFCHDLDGTPCDSTAIAFRLAPAVAAAGRLDWAEVGFQFLTAQSLEEAQGHWAILKRENALRKEIEKGLRERAFQAASKSRRMSIILYLENGHSGVHGITASRVVESFGKPAGIFSDRGAGARQVAPDRIEEHQNLLSGSFRGIAGFNVREALQRVCDRQAGIFVGFGGHVGAAGATIRKCDFDRFAEAFEEAVVYQLKDRVLKPELWVDGELTSDQLNLDTVDLLGSLDPWGKDFPVPTYVGHFRVKALAPVGDGSHLRLTLESGKSSSGAIWFSACDPGGPVPVNEGETVRLVFRVGDNSFQGVRRFQLNVVGLA